MLSVFWNHNKYITFQTHNEKEEFVLHLTKKQIANFCGTRTEGTSNLVIYDNKWILEF